MSSPCWSLPHLLTSSLPRHEAPPGQHDLPKTTLYTVLLFQNLFSRQAALMNRSHSESGGNPRNTSPAGCEPKELATISGSSLEDIYQLYDVQREFGEQDQQAPIIEEVKESGVSQFVQTHSFLDHEMAEMSLVEKRSYLQSQMHFDESMESTADSDLEDGELQKLLTSPRYAQRASGKPDAMVVQEREVSAQTSPSSEDQRASGKPAALFSPKRNEQRNQMWSSVCSETPICRIWVDSARRQKDQLLNQARSQLAKRELLVESVHRWFTKNGGAKHGTIARTKRICWISSRTNSTTRRIVYERKKLFEIRRFGASTNWEKWRERKYNKLMNSRCKNELRKTRLFNSSLPNCSKCKNRWIFCQWFGRISRCGIEFLWKVVSRFQSSCDDSYVWFTRRLSTKNSIWRRAKKPRSSPGSRKDEHCSHKWRQTKSRHNSNADICNKTVHYEFYNARGSTTELHGRTAEKADIGIAIRQIPQSTIVFWCGKFDSKLKWLPGQGDGVPKACHQQAHFHIFHIFHIFTFSFHILYIFSHFVTFSHFHIFNIFAFSHFYIFTFL